MVERVLIILLNLSWQLALIFALSWLIMVIFRIRSASVKHIIWLAVALCPLVLLPMNFVSSDIVLLHDRSFERGTMIDHQSVLPRLSFDQGTGSLSAIAPIEKEPLGKPIPLRVEGKASSDHRLSESIWAKLTLLLTIAWISGAGVCLTLICAGYLRLKKLISEAREVKDAKALGIFHSAMEEVGVSRRVRLLTSDKAQTPFSVGFVRPCIILPDQILDSCERLRMALIHEIVHLKRLDGLVNLFCRFIGSFMFFHPLFHLAIRELQLSSEQICDEWAIGLTGMREDYANCLLELSRARLGRLPIGFSENRSSMARRMKYIFKDKEAFKMVGKRSLMFISLSAFFLILMVSTARLVDSASTGVAARISQIDRFQQCKNTAGAGFFWVDTTNGGVWWADPGNARWVYGRLPKGAEHRGIGTYMPCPNKGGTGLFVVNTFTGRVWWARGYKQEWIDLRKPETANAGEIGAYIPCENMDGAGLFVLNTATGSGWWTPPTNEQDWKTLDNPDAKAGEIGTYIPFKNKSGTADIEQLH